MITRSYEDGSYCIVCGEELNNSDNHRGYEYKNCLYCRDCLVDELLDSMDEMEVRFEWRGWDIDDRDDN